MRIAHIESSLHWGGQELRIIEQMLWLRLQGHTVWLIAHSHSAILREARRAGLACFPLDIHNAFSLPILWRLYWFLRNHQIDIIDTHSQKDSYQVCWIKWLTGITVVRSRHITNQLRNSFAHYLVWRYGNDRVVVTAQTIKAQLISLGLKSAQAIDVAVAGVDEKRFHPCLREKNQALRAMLGIPADHWVIANIGMIREDKGQLIFVHACNEIANHFNNVTFLQIGEATNSSQTYKQQVLATVANLPNKQHIHFLGYRVNIEDYLSICDIVVIASIATEAQTRLVSQAFLTKTAVVATLTGGLVEMIEPEKTGLLCPANSATALAESTMRLLRDAELREYICANAYQQAHQYWTFTQMMNGMLASYQHAFVANKKLQLAQAINYATS
ncbi:glycosyltransferase family 4 protein [Beggiatoa leptomitoformis]|uniref:Glycosyltransferase n=1 Tax=Beggiatoa leptomitoformis TaxID=288004 RepID=A0A2N9YBV1_9GAMM|nr:glycosyltransferase family 4 protein [Beggiatoa leptomitoformis]ALG66696.1 glycosyltransferase [Beggiatoa leptomitoformis]AUI67977.1 glycosyltransferase [Beggiatoa leptomitoformis]